MGWTQERVDSFLAQYHRQLVERLPGSVGKDYTVDVMYQHFDLCVVDFIRWWAGFRSGQHFWAMPWAMDILRRVLHKLDGGKLLDELQYAQAVDRDFPLL